MHALASHGCEASRLAESMMDYAPANGFGNQMQALRVALRIAVLLNRTLVLGPMVPRNYTNPHLAQSRWSFHGGDCRWDASLKGHSVPFGKVPSAVDMINRTIDFSTHTGEHLAYVPMLKVLDRTALERLVHVADRHEVEQCLKSDGLALKAHISDFTCANVVLVDDPLRHGKTGRCATRKPCPLVDVRTEFGSNRAQLIRFGSLFRTTDFVPLAINSSDYRDVLTTKVIEASVTFAAPLRALGCGVAADLVTESGDLLVAIHVRGGDKSESLIGPSLNSLKLLKVKMKKVYELFVAALTRGERLRGAHGARAAALFVVSNLNQSTLAASQWWNAHVEELRTRLRAAGIGSLSIRMLVDFPLARKKASLLLPGAGEDASAMIEIIVAASAPAGFVGGPSTFSYFINEQRTFAPPCKRQMREDERSASPMVIPVATAATSSVPARASAAGAKCDWTPAKSAIDFCEAYSEAHSSGRLPERSILVDVGAAFGWEAMIARRRGVRVLSFECRGDEYRNLVTHFGSDPGYHIAQLCLSNASGRSLLYRAADSSSLLQTSIRGSREARKARREPNKTEEVSMATLDHFLAESMWPASFHPHSSAPKVGFLKIDTQGHDEAVLRGAISTILRDRPFVLYEDMFALPELRGGVLLHNLMRANGASTESYSCRRWGHPAWNSFCTPALDPPS